MNTPLEGKSPNSKYFWKSEKADVVRRRRAREARASGDGPSTTREDHPSTPNCKVKHKPIIFIIVIQSLWVVIYYLLNRVLYVVSNLLNLVLYLK